MRPIEREASIGTRSESARVSVVGEGQPVAMTILRHVRIEWT